MNKATELLKRAFGILYELNGFDILNEKEAKVLEDIESHLDSEPARKPMTEKQIRELLGNPNYRPEVMDTFIAGIRIAEKYHRIGKDNGRD